MIVINLLEWLLATYIKLKTGHWQAQVARKKIRTSKSFKTKREAKDWAARQEHLILSGSIGAASLLLGDIFVRYARDVSPKKGGARWEIIRFKLFSRYDICNISLKNLTTADFAKWRDTRLSEVSPASVNRELTLMSAALSCARKEWGLIASNPLTDVLKLKKPPPRNRLVANDEIETLTFITGTNL